jgi:predicted short-subunit dehydrogenase-like oxidoreductase (DUF2520 family)
LNCKNVTIIGAGKIAYSIVPALKKSGYNIPVIISRKIESAKKLAVKFGVPKYSGNLEEIYNGGGIVFLCIPDNQIKITAKKISGLKLPFSKYIFVHLSGALDISTLDALKKKKGLTASLHIMQSFPTKRPVPIKSCYAAVETESKTAREILFGLAKNISLKPFKLNSESKTFYHLAGVFASNFLVGNLYEAKKAFEKTGNKQIDFFEMISPIVSSTLANIKKAGVVNALSGPIERGDIQTVKKHLSTLKKDTARTKNNTMLINYIAQSLSLLEVAEKKHGDISIGMGKMESFLIEEHAKSGTIKQNLIKQKFW